MNLVYKMVAVCAVTVVAAVGVYSQEITKDDSKPVVVDQQTTTTPDYVFPTHRERFNRYLKSTVGPFRLVWSAGAAGIDQWRDHPEEWGQ